ncbi:MaoC family dehydratase [Rhodoferax ferrireducens]|uniref:MaoC family dehydratase n=1 Tax=Rhodoferax ferrireducens TaxID=192843 RepID=UPI000E0E0053|nr:MaoC/PaaZ C-terminal domain-containing protein [Rhodoferax ferrireducens]
MSTSPFPASIELSCGPVTAVDLALYAAASGDHNPLHLDDAVARTAGFDRPVVHGMLTMAYVGRLFTQRFGCNALLALNTRFIGVAKRGDNILLHAQLSECDGKTAQYRLRGCTESGAEIVSGSARVRLPPRANATKTAL